MKDNEPGSPCAPLSAAAVNDYLLANPEFFHTHKALLTKLVIPHPAGGAVSLVERQVEILRQENRRLERRLIEWMEIAEDNDRLLGHLHRLAVGLLSATSAKKRAAAVLERLGRDFNADAVSIVVHHREAAEALPGYCHYLARDDTALQRPSASPDEGKPWCGPLSATQAEKLFPEADRPPGSAAFVPITVRSAAALLVLASNDARHFHSGLDTTYLTRLGELTAAALGEPRA